MGKGVQSFVKGLALTSFCHGGGAARVDTRDGKILRIRPLHYDDSYTAAEIGQWRVKARGKTFESKLRTLPNPHGLSYKNRVYSPNRIMYPLKRVDWDPGGNRNPQNRGRSKYKRISWEEATDLIAGEIRRIRAEYDPYAIFLQGDGHGESKTVHASHGCNIKLFDCLDGGVNKGKYTLQVRTPDSWEGWKWGGTHMWGMLPFGVYKFITNAFKDIAEHTDMLLHWGADWESSHWQSGGQDNSLWAYYFSELGIKHIFISPDLNFSAAVHADKWIPVLPNTDSALALAIAYIWITEDTYHKKYLDTHAHGFNKFKAYVMGENDGISKTPEWASPLCGVPSRTIKALARKWASSVAAFAMRSSGNLCRGPYSSEPTRLQIALEGMQGMGRAGTNRPSQMMIPRPKVQLYGFAAYQGLEEAKCASISLYPKQFIPKTRLCDAILDASKEKPLKFYSTGSYMMPTEDQFVEYQYPAKGCSEIHMIWSDTPCWQTCWNAGNRIDEAFRSPKIETIVVQHPWMENDTLYADIILPTCTKFETRDIMIGSDSFCNSIYPEEKCIEPIGESKSDYEAVAEVAKKLGIYEEFTEGKTVDEWIKFGYDHSKADQLISWEELNKKGYYCIPPADDWEKDPPGGIKFYEDPITNPLKTPTGKIEYESTGLLENFPDDEERPPVPHWIPYGKTHQESLLHPRAKQYPLLVISNHPRWRHHAQLDDVTWLREISTCKVTGPDGYLYEPVWLHPSEANKRNIRNGDIVEVFNERGSVLGGAFVTERLMPGVLFMSHGARTDTIIPGKLDRGGAINLITPSSTLSPKTQGQVATAFLVEVKKVDLVQMETWKKQYPEAFKRDYDPASGLRFDAWVEGDM